MSLTRIYVFDDEVTANEKTAFYLEKYGTSVALSGPVDRFQLKGISVTDIQLDKEEIYVLLVTTGNLRTGHAEDE